MEKISNKLVDLLPLKTHDRLKDRSLIKQRHHAKPVKQLSIHTPAKVCPSSINNCTCCGFLKGSKSFGKCKGNRTKFSMATIEETD